VKAEDAPRDVNEAVTNALAAAKLILNVGALTEGELLQAAADLAGLFLFIDAHMTTRAQLPNRWLQRSP
jgi:hypothetical protein